VVRSVGKNLNKFESFQRIRRVQNTTSCHDFGTMNPNWIRISTVRGHAPYKYPPCNTMPKSPNTNSNLFQISWSDTSFSPTGSFDCICCNCNRRCNRSMHFFQSVTTWLGGYNIQSKTTGDCKACLSMPKTCLFYMVGTSKTTGNWRACLGIFPYGGTSKHLNIWGDMHSGGTIEAGVKTQLGQSWFQLPRRDRYTLLYWTQRIVFTDE